MKIITEIIGNSAIGNSSYMLKTFVLSIFTTIVITLGVMLTVLIGHSNFVIVQFGY